MHNGHDPRAGFVDTGLTNDKHVASLLKTSTASASFDPRLTPSHPSSITARGSDVTALPIDICTSRCLDDKQSCGMLEAQYAQQTRDPRSSSTQSLLPTPGENESKRTLLVVYIHGFMGNDASFHAFPVHVHHCLREELFESHVIHSKTYPRYKTYKAIQVARNNFSKWLEPHENENTDVILVGHSMGGLLAADVALMPSQNSASKSPFKHRILGIVCMDAPLLGLHPGIIKSGIASLFKKAPEASGEQQDLGEALPQDMTGRSSLDDRPGFADPSLSTDISSPDSISRMSSNTSASSQSDPNFNPAFFNDIQVVDKGWWRNAAHFTMKHHSEGLFSSTCHHLISYLEFGSCLADYASLNSRYNQIRRLEDVDELNQSGRGSRREARVRLINYYTVSTGRPARTPAPKRSDTHLRPSQSKTRPSSQASTPRISIEDLTDSAAPQISQTLQLLESMPEPEEVVGGSKANCEIADESDNGKLTTTKGYLRKETNDSWPTQAGTEAENICGNAQQGHNEANDLPAIPMLPDPPHPPDLDRYADKDVRKQAEKDFKRAQKGYERYSKDRDRTIKERQKLMEKSQKQAQKEGQKRQKEETKRLAKQQLSLNAQEKKETINSVKAVSDSLDHAESRCAAGGILEGHLALDGWESSKKAPNQEQEPAPQSGGVSPDLSPADDTKKLRKFCMLPPKIKGACDPVWVQVYMKDVDEVGAHCGLFLPGPHYETLIGDVGSRIADWVREDASRRVILGMT